MNNQRMTDTFHWLHRTLALLVMVLFANLAGLGGADESKSMSLKELRIPFPYKEGEVRVISGTGREILTLTPKRISTQDPSEEAYAHAYYSPHVHPNQDRIICVRCNNFSLKSNLTWARRSCEVVEVFLNEDEPRIRVVFTPPPGNHVISPVWSPDGRQIAFFLGRSIGILDMATGKIVQQTEAIDHGHPPSKFALALRTDYLRWSKDGSRIFIWVAKWGPTYAGRDRDLSILEAHSGVIKRFGGYRTYEEGRWEDLPEKFPAADFEAVHTLFGVNENRFSTPFVRPIWSPDRRYYFSYKQREGFWAKGWIERYDTQTEKRKKVRTLWWAPYRE